MSARGPDSRLGADNRVHRPVTFFDHGLFLVHLNRGKECLKRGEYDEARLELETAQRFRPNDPEVLSNLAFTLFHLGHYEEAETMTRDLLVSHADSVPLLFNLGLILFRGGRELDAIDPLEKVLELAPDHRKAHLALGLILQRAGQTERAKKHLKSAGAGRKEGTDFDDTVARTARGALSVRPPAKGAAASSKTAPVTPIPVVKPESPDAVSPRAEAGDGQPVAETEEHRKTAPVALAEVKAELKPETEAKAPVKRAMTVPLAPAPVRDHDKTSDGMPIYRPVIEEPADTLEEPKTAPIVSPLPQAPAPAAPPPSTAAVAVAAAAMAPAAPSPFEMRAGGFVSASCRNGVYVKRGLLMGRTGSPVFEPDDRLRGPLEHLLVKAAGDGTVLLVDKGKKPHLLRLAGDFLSVEPSRLVAFEAALAFREDPAFEFRRRIAEPYVKLYGTGMIALGVHSEPARFDVTLDEPMTIASSAVIAYGGDLFPELLEDADPLAELGSGPVFRFAGRGYVLADVG